MVKDIISILNELGIAQWMITENQTDSHELFLIKHREDMRRAKSVVSTSVNVYHDFETGGKAMRGSAKVLVYPGTTHEELKSKLSGAYESAGYVKNPYYELAPCGGKNKIDSDKCDLKSMADEMSRALFAAEEENGAYINSAEIFAERTDPRIVVSTGTDVSFSETTVYGDFVTQIREPKDVEYYQGFRYAHADASALTDLARQALTIVKDRAAAENAPKNGSYDVIFVNDQVPTILGAFVQRANAAMIYPGYSTYKVGTQLQSENGKGEKLNISVFSNVPYSGEGIYQPERELIREGSVMAISGDTRFCRYMGLEPTGSYYCFRVDNGTLTLDEMKKRRCLVPVAFSDFQCDALRGSFGGEIRLAYLFDENGVTLLTGGSINGSLTQKQDELVFSKEKYETLNYSGPKAMLIPGVSVAGAE